MNPYQFKVECSVCGGPGYGTYNAMLAQWGRYPGNHKFGNPIIVHDNPTVCRDYLARQRQELNVRLSELGKEVQNAANS